MTSLLAWLRGRLRERSTWLGLTSLITACGMALSPEQVEAIAAIGLALGGVLAAFTADRT